MKLLDADGILVAMERNDRIALEIEDVAPVAGAAGPGGRLTRITRA